MTGTALRSHEAGVHAHRLQGTVAVAANLAATPRARLLRLEVATHAGDFRAGQAVMVGLHGSGHRQPYSIASSPEQVEETGRLELLIGYGAECGMGSPLLRAAPGTLIDLDGPFGAFVCPDAPPTTHWLFVAGGVGIAPVRAMVDHLMRRRSAHLISLLHSARVPRELAFSHELRGHAGAGRLHLCSTVTRESPEGWDGARGRIGRPQFEAVLQDPGRTLCFICGPIGLVRDSVATLSLLGVPEALIRTGHC